METHQRSDATAVIYAKVRSMPTWGAQEDDEMDRHSREQANCHTIHMFLANDEVTGLVNEGNRLRRPANGRS
ncbi:hypothetical protein MRB53_041460 [Persea americana]|nr:hypothetical protein MRB53_041460 [Persea americana]